MNPVVLAVAIMVTLGMEVLMYGVDEFAPANFPSLDNATPEIDRSVCNESGWGDAVMCVAITIGQWIANFFGFVIWLFQVIGYVALWFAGLASFGIDGAPWFARVTFGVLITTSAGWTLAKFIRK